MKTQLKFQSLTLLICLLSFYSCKNTQTHISYDKSEKILINVDSIKESIDISQYVQNVNIFPLKESFGNVLGEVEKILKTDSQYIVFDKLNSKRIVVFNNKGDFVAKPADVGRSTGDPVQINDCWLTPSEDLGVYDFAAKKIFIYDKNFKLVNQIQSPYDRVFTKLINSDDKGYIGYKGFTFYNSLKDGENYKVAFLDTDLSLDEGVLPYEDVLNDALIPNTSSPIQKIGDNVLITEEYNHSVLATINNLIYERYDIEYSKDALEGNYLQTRIIPNISLFKEENPDFHKINSLFNGKFYFSGNWRETKGYIILESYDKTGKNFYTLIQKNKNKIIGSAYNLYHKPSNTFLPPFYTGHYATNEFIAIYPGYALKTIVPDGSQFSALLKANSENNYVVNVRFN